MPFRIARITALAAAAATLAAAAPAQDTSPAPTNEGPSFPCATPSGDVEKMICADPALAALDRQMAAAWAEAGRRADPPLPQAATAEQKTWIEGRNACSKEADPRACIQSRYTMRIARLQARYKLVSAIGPVHYRCVTPAGRPSVIVATYYQTDPPSAILDRDDESLFVTLGPTGSGARYVGPDLVFWSKGKGAQVTWLGSEMSCISK
jgi:uncharacterized protein